MDKYEAVAALHDKLPQFSPYIPTGTLGTFSFFSLATTFALGFYFSTLPKDTLPLRESAVATTASVLGGFGVVALFCNVGVYV